MVPPPGSRGDAVGEEVALGDEHAGRARPAGKLVRREEDRVLVREVAVLDVGRGVHLDREVRARGRVVPEGQRAVPVEQDRDGVDVRDDARDVRRCREASDLQRPCGVALELLAQVVEVEAAVAVLPDDDDIRDRLAPRQLVRVVLERADEDDRPLGCAAKRPSSRTRSRRSMRPRRARAGEDDHVVLPAADGPVDDPARLLAQPRRLEPGRRGLRVRVGVERQHLAADEVLDERERAARGGVVGVDEPAQAEGPFEESVVADHGRPDPLQQGRCGTGALWAGEDERFRCGRAHASIPSLLEDGPAARNLRPATSRR